MNLVKLNNRRPVSNFHPFFDDFFTRDFSPRLNHNCNTKATNVKETEDHFVIEMSAPGLTKDDITIEINNNSLTISSSVSNMETDENFTKREFWNESFSRTFRLPKNVNKENISAKYDKGILNVTLPKDEKTKEKEVRKIDIV